MIALYVILGWALLGALGTLGLNRKKLSLGENIRALGLFMVMGPLRAIAGWRCYVYNRDFARNQGDGK